MKYVYLPSLFKIWIDLSETKVSINSDWK